MIINKTRGGFVHEVLDFVICGISSSVSIQTSDAIHDLNIHDQEFFLTGSRFFGTWNRDSDFDFYTLYLPKIESYLLGVGFLEAHDSSYDDALTKLVLCKGDVHVQLILDTHLKNEIQKIMAEYGIIGRDKHKNTKVWNVMINLALKLNGRVLDSKVTVSRIKYCSCSGNKVQRTAAGNDYWYCQGCGKEHIP